MIIFTNARGNESSCVAYFKYLISYIVFHETHIPHYTLYISVVCVLIIQTDCHKEFQYGQMVYFSGYN